MADWQELTRLTRGGEFVVERVRIVDNDVAIEGDFELPAIAQLRAEDQIFIMAFVRAHGSIKEMERVFGISYPTVKNRLNRISERLPLIEVEDTADSIDVIDQLERGEITTEEAMRRLNR